MASHAGGVIQDQNQNIPYGEASVGWKTNVSKAPRKEGGMGGRTALGDLSNSLKLSLNQATKKQASSMFSFTRKDSGASQIALDATKKKNTIKASLKQRPAGRKALRDISNSGKPQITEASKKNYNAKLSLLEEEPIHPSKIAEEQFLHNHQECINAQSRAMDMNQVLKTVGLDNDFLDCLATQPANSSSFKVEAQSPLGRIEPEEMTEHLIEDQCWTYMPHKLDSPPVCKTPISPRHSVQWSHHDNINFKLLETP